MAKRVFEVFLEIFYEERRPWGVRRPRSLRLERHRDSPRGFCFLRAALRLSVLSSRAHSGVTVARPMSKTRARSYPSSFQDLMLWRVDKVLLVSSLVRLVHAVGGPARQRARARRLSRSRSVQRSRSDAGIDRR